MTEGAALRPPSLLQSMIPVVTLIGLLSASVYLFRDGASGGANQVALMLAASVAAVIGIVNGYRWDALQAGIVHGISLSMGAVLILLVVGSLIGTWILAGIVPTMIAYGLQLLSPDIFYPATCVICCIVSLATGSSWTTAGTVGIALVGVAGAQNLSLPMTAGAIISGAYFGDKMSPLSDTTNLAPAMAGAELFAHIRHMVYTTAPSIVIAVVLFALVGWWTRGVVAAADLSAILGALHTQFRLGPHLLIPPVIVLLLVVGRVPALPALLIGALVGGLFAVVFQSAAVVAYAADPALPRPLALVKGVWMALFQGFKLTSGTKAVDDLLSRGGMGSMMNTVWLILAAMTFGAVMETTRMLERLARSVLGFVRGAGSLIVATLGTSIGMNIIASDQYIAIVLPGRMFRAEYARRGLHPKNLSRCLEDAGTLTSPLVPWNTCGAFMSQTLGVATAAYLPWCFFNLISPLVSAAYGLSGFTIERLPEAAATGESVAPEAALA
jgi:NhaC family Na+:H+ antiporter